MDNYCNQILNRYNKCIKPCPFIKKYYLICNNVCKENMENNECQFFIQVVDLILPELKKTR